MKVVEYREDGEDFQELYHKHNLQDDIKHNTHTERALFIIGFG